MHVLGAQQKRSSDLDPRETAVLATSGFEAEEADASGSYCHGLDNGLIAPSACALLGLVGFRPNMDRVASAAPVWPARGLLE